MKENIEELRANVERTEMAGLTFIATRVACARAALDYIAQLEQSSRAQRTDEGKWNSAAAPVAADTEQATDAERYRILRSAKKIPASVWHALETGENIDQEVDFLIALNKVIPMCGPCQQGRHSECQHAIPCVLPDPAQATARKLVPLEATDEMIDAACEAGNLYRVDAMRAVEAAIAAAPAAPLATPADTEQATDELSNEEQAALDRLDKPEWRAASNLKLRAILAVEVANCIRMGAKIENLQDELRATEGYRRGYTDGTTDAAGMADVQNDWRGIWDEAPVQGEGVLATDGATVIAARWFATGWAKHDHFSDELEYLPEGWVTHWKPFPPAQDANAQGGK